MTKDDFIRKQLSKTNRKSFESYVVYGIYHAIKHLDIEFVTQQMVQRQEGRALVDMFFPSLKMYIEVNEEFHQKQVNADRLREFDIENAIGFSREDIDASKGLKHLDKEINRVVDAIKELHSKVKPGPWEFEKRISSDYWIEKEEIFVDDNVCLQYAKDVYHLFGRERKTIQHGGLPHPREKGKRIWIPSIFEVPEQVPDNFKFENGISEDEETVMATFETKEERDECFDKPIFKDTPTYVVFVKRRDNLGAWMYRYKGEYLLNVEKSKETDNMIFWDRVSKRSKVYKTVS